MKNFSIFLLFSLLLVAPLFSQVGERPKRPMIRGIGVISGYVHDAKDKTPLQYASVIAYRLRDSAKVTGIATDQKGHFKLTGLRPGSYYLEVDFIGYKKETVSPIKITPQKPTVNLGIIKLQPAYILTSPVEVKGERPPITYKIDKKVIDVKKMATSISGTAVDVLENVPSVSVDIEGNVKLRGSENLTILIDGRPVLLEPSEILQQIPASSIDQIEIITNPSAKYDPEGVAGIINIVLKKKHSHGISGTLNTKLGTYENYGGGLLFDLRRSKYNSYISLNYDRRFMPGNLASERQTSTEKSNYRILSNGDFRRYHNPANLRGGIDINVFPTNILSIGGSYGRWQMGGSTGLSYEEQGDSFSDPLSYNSIDTFKLRGPSLSGFVNYQHKFPRKGHKLTGEIYYSHRQRDVESWNQRSNENGEVISGERSKEEGPSSLLRLKMDYSHPLGVKNKLETGYQGRWDSSEDNLDLYEYAPDSGEYEFQPQSHHDSRYFRNIQAIYGLYAGEIGAFGYQAGLRLEYTYRNIQIVDSNKKFEINRTDHFPTFHLSYKFPGIRQIMASYSRRIWRPRSWWLEPSLTWMDAYNVRQGNPALKPEYIDSYEMGLETPMGKGYTSLDAYYRVTHDHIERTTTLYEDNIFLHTFKNAGTSYAGGIELVLNLSPIRWYDINWMLDLYNYRIEGVEKASSRESNNWNIRFNNEIRLKLARFQVNGRYYSPTVTSEGKRSGFFIVDLAMKKTLFSRKLTLTLQARDVLQTAKREYTSEGENFSYHSTYERKSPLLMLQITYNFNNYQQFKKKIPKEENEEDFEIY